MWASDEKRLLKSLKTPEKIQNYIDDLIYNPEDAAASPRMIMLTGDGHCFEGGLLAAAALEFHGHPPLMVSLQAEDDDHHVIAVYKTKTGWGSIAKSNTTLLRGRDPVYRDIRELVMSYFDFYFNTKGRKSLYAYSDAINLNRYNHWDWRYTEGDLVEMGMALNDLDHYEIISQVKLKSLPKVKKSLIASCFSGADPEGLFKAKD